MKIELIHPPHFNSTDDRLDPPLGLLYIGTTLKEQGHDVVVNDLCGLPDKKSIKVGHADMYGITVYCSTLSVVRYIIARCLDVNPKAKIVLGGAHMTALPTTFADLADHTVTGYGEVPMTDLASEMKEDRVIKGHILPEPIDVDWSLIDPHSYHREIDGKKSLPILTSRGCPYKCSFCGLHAMHNICSYIKFADPEQVIESARKIKDLGIGALNIQDDIFTLNRKRLREILSGLKKLEMPFRCMGRAGYDTEETYEMLADAGCTGVAWGIESGSQEMLDKMNKATKVEDNYDVIKWCKKYGMDSRAFFIIGFPGETKETLEETKQFILKADPDQYFCSNFIPYPATPVWDNPLAFGILEMSYDFDEYYQVSKDGTGGAVISTKWMNKAEFKEAEIELRKWLADNKPMRGKNIQQYEKDGKDGNERCDIP